MCLGGRLDCTAYPHVRSMSSAHAMMEASVGMFTGMEGKLKKKGVKAKEASNQRVYDKDGYRRRVDCLLFRNSKKQEVLLVSSRNHPDLWTIAGGGIEPLETPAQAAVREGHEEAGVTCEVIGSIGVFEDKERKTRTEAFSMLVTSEAEDYLDKNNWGRSKKWFSVKEAIEILNMRQKYDKMAYFALAGCEN